MRFKAPLRTSTHELSILWEERSESVARKCHNDDMPNSDRSLASRGEEWASRLAFSGMTMQTSHEIADTWKYPQPFDFYDV